MMKNLAALILAGGRGSRMDLLCHMRPKPILPFAGKYRVIDFTLTNCAHSRIADVGVMVDYQRALMTEYLKRWQEENSGGELAVLRPRSGSYAGTADAVYQNLDFLDRCGAEDILILAGDHVYKMDYRKMLAFHEAMQADVTIGTTRVPMSETHRFGTLSVHEDGSVAGFVEKSPQAQSNLASMGIYIFRKSVLVACLERDAAQPGSPHDFGYAILPAIISQGQRRVFAYEFTGYWQDIGAVDAYYDAHMQLLTEAPGIDLDRKWPILTHRSQLPVHIGENARVVNSIISPGCVVDGYLRNSVLSPGVRVEEGARVANAIVMANSRIGRGSVVEGCILDEDVDVGGSCRLGFGRKLPCAGHNITLVGKGTAILPGSAIGHNLKISAGSRTGHV
jgi:glucose-1-phosphate adenylyltransferase